MPGITVSDTSCLILFNKIEELELLKKLFGKIYITETVLKEFNQPVPDWIEILQLKSEVQKSLSGFLDPGEASSIALASEHESSLLIMDEVKGRKTAKKMGISVTGSLGLIVIAKEKGHIKAVKPLLEKIRKTNFRISDDLIGRVLLKAGES
jgi:predicted nucleic acid-binding protein